MILVAHFILAKDNETDNPVPPTQPTFSSLHLPPGWHRPSALADARPRRPRKWRRCQGVRMTRRSGSRAQTMRHIRRRRPRLRRARLQLSNYLAPVLTVRANCVPMSTLGRCVTLNLKVYLIVHREAVGCYGQKHCCNGILIRVTGI